MGETASVGDHPHPSPLRALLRGASRRCPRCGSGGLFPTWFSLVERCPTCGLSFSREEGAWLGAFVISFAATEAVLAAIIAVSIAVTLPDPPALKLSIGAGLAMIAFPLAFYPFAKTIWAAIDLLMHPLGEQERAAAARAVERTAPR